MATKITITDPNTGKSRERWRGSTYIKGRRVYRTAETKREVEQALDELKRRDQDGLSQDDPTLTVGRLLADWLREVVPEDEKVKSVNTIANKTWAIEKHLVPALGKVKLRELTKLDIERVFRSKAKAGLSKSTILRLRAVLVEALTYAEDHDLVHRNVARGAAIPKSAKPVKPVRSLTPEQAKKLLDAAESIDPKTDKKRFRLEALYVTALSLGLRSGEIRGLRWADVDLDAGTLTISGSLKSEGKVLRLGDTKTEKSRRTLGLPGRVVDALRAHQGRQLDEALAVTADSLVFTTLEGTPIDPSNLRRDLSKITKAAEIGKWTPTELRKSCASILSDGGVSNEQVADQLGHVDTKMVEKHYRTRVNPVVTAGVDTMEKLLG